MTGFPRATSAPEDAAARAKLLELRARRVEHSQLVGTATHQLIAYLAEKHRYGVANPAQVDAAAKRLLARRKSPSSRQALRIAVSTLAGVYVERFWPSRSRLIAAELVVGDVALDLLWLLPGGAMMADELKTGMFAGPAHPATKAQGIAQAEQGALLLGRDYQGVRVCILRRPTTSFFLAAPGARGEVPTLWRERCLLGQREIPGEQDPERGTCDLATAAASTPTRRQSGD